ncbi:MAG: hypothetical protein JW910_17580 [Anaerolineae bacterium]|nr:hypothetical protein [Anaerolineae bacterium]
MNKDWTVQGGEMSDRFRQALGAGEEVLFYQRSMTGQNCLIRGICWWLGAGSIVGSLATGDATAMLCGVGIGVFFLALPFLLPEHEYAVTTTRLIVGKRVFGQFSYDVVPVDMISGIKVGSSTQWFYQGQSQLTVQHGGGSVILPVMGGKSGEDVVLHLTRLLEERRTHAAHRQAPPAAPQYAPPPTPAAAMDKKQQLDLLRQRLLQGQISEETYNRLRKEIEES